ncbi:MAG TPA: hypothetical protein VIJ15_07715, partial [Dermatophilaceae bacterium]
VARHADVPAPHLPVQVRAARPLICMETPDVLVPAAPELEGADLRSRTGTAWRKHPALLRALVPRRRKQDHEQAVAEG